MLWAIRIKRVSVKNFKSIGSAGVDIELKPLIFFVGPNGGGKSAILEAIAASLSTDGDDYSKGRLGYVRGLHWIYKLDCARVMTIETVNLPPSEKT